MKRYLKPEIVMIGSAILILWVAYQLAISKTVAAWQLHQKLSKQTDRTELSIPSSYQERINQNLAGLTQVYTADSLTFHSRLIRHLSELADQQQIKLADLPEAGNLSTGKLNYQTVTFEGDYFHLLKALDQLEQKQGVGYIRSLTFERPVLNGPDNNPKPVRLKIYMAILRSSR
ncbi:hypothetical protein MUY27_20180 [Mucilaginibacter sp. RS28]|uniref:Uncharacterized protein n=1 Tax=Mucilaginibacter straminoryzae TaxID=2932774 RepID=A0A9X1X7M9_9SPHI|nr:hypothetical protein [Mucilaginibacter straminoryzae]MCJ8212046.1 hypothetical protein [Mucilaginibacter straminoryzae]